MATLIERLEAALLTIENSATKQDEVIDGGINDFITTGFGNIRSLANAINIISSINIKGAWATSTAYTLKDLVVESGTYYICLEAHTSGVFATDLTAKKWAVYQFNKETVTITATTFNVDKESTILLDTSSNNITANLPDATLIPGLLYIFKKINAANTGTIDPFGSQTVDGSLTFNLDSNNDSVVIQSDGSNWRIINEYSPIPTTTATKTSAYTVVSSDNGNTILLDSSGGAFTVDLSAALALGNGFNVKFKKIDSSTNSITIDPNASETIDGKLTLGLNGQYGDLSLVCDGTNFHSLSYDSRWISWTPTYTTSGSMTWTSITTEHARYKIVNDVVFFEIFVHGTTGGTQSNELRFTLPVNPENDGVAWAGRGFDSSSTAIREASGAWISGSSYVQVNQADNSNWALGSYTGFSINGFYKI